MIKANIIVDNKVWEKNLNNPKLFFKKKLKILSKIKFFNKKKHYLTILLTTNKVMKKLNSKFRKRNKTTDVLSFPFQDKIKKNSYLGDIAISYEIIKKRSHKSSFIIELDKMWIHGLLHLLGYNHKKLSEYSKMNYRENLILKNFHQIN